MSSRSRIRLHAPPVATRLLPGDARAALEELESRLRADAFEAGRAAGREEGRAEALAGPAARLETAAEALEAARAALPEEAAKDVVVLACEIAGQLLRFEVDAGRYDLEAVIRETLREADAGRAPCTVHLHPDDAAAAAHVQLRSGTVVEADVEIARGDVHVSTPQGLMVRDLGAALAAVREALLSPDA